MKTDKIDKGLRFTNYLVDYTVVMFVCIGFMAVFNNLGSGVGLFYFVTFFYYLVFESISKQTLGKMLTKTEVVKKDGSPAKFINILMRSVSRLIPFDALSYLFGTERGFHDVLSSTKLIPKKS